MSWGEKIPETNDLLLFLDTWKSRNQIKEKYNLTDIESWNCMKYLKGLSFYVEYKRNEGITNKAHLVRTRRFAILEIIKSKQQTEK